MKGYHVEVNYNNQLGWRRAPFAEHRLRVYCDGFVDAYDSMYPSRPLRIVKTMADGSTRVVRETRGHAKPHVN